MLSISRSTNPYVRGIKPRVFFEQRHNMIKKEIMLNDSAKHYYPEKGTSNNRRKSDNPNWVSNE